MYLFTFHPQYQALVCKPCGYAVAPSCLASHTRTKHPNDACLDAGLPFSRSKKPAARLAKRLQEKFDILDPAVDKISVPLPTEAPVPALKLYRAYKCTRCGYVLPKGRQPRVADILISLQEINTL
ncbi:hypothetical protein M3J09_007515 [Ascochyta lentis]